MSDAIKTVILEAVCYAVHDNVQGHIEDRFRASELPAPTVEISEIAPSEHMIRVVDGKRSSAPRYFRVKTSEVM